MVKSIDISGLCTTGFVATDSSGNDGVLTAAHCSTNTGLTSFTYNGNDGATHTLNVQNSSNVLAANRSRNHDITFLTGSTTFPAQFYPDSSTTTRSVTGTRFRTSTNTNGWFSTGSHVCHNGITTGKSCGEVQSIKYKPTWSGACGSNTCNAVFVKMEGPNLACFGGDSGGPMYAWNTAFGIQKGASFSGTAPGQCNFLIYSSIDYVSELGVSVKF